MPSIVVRGRHLLVEVAVLGHPGRLRPRGAARISPQRPAGLRRPQRRDEVPGLLLQLLVAECKRRHPLAATWRRRPCAPPPCPAGRARSGPASRSAGPAVARSPAGAGRDRPGWPCGPRSAWSRPGSGTARCSSPAPPPTTPRRLRRGSAALLLGPARGLVLRTCATAAAPRRRLPGPSRLPPPRSTRPVSWAASSSDRACASASRPSARRAAPAVRASARHVPGDADGETGGEPDDHSEDHEANVTTGCVNNGDRPLPLLAATTSARDFGVVTQERNR